MRRKHVRNFRISHHHRDLVTLHIFSSISMVCALSYRPPPTPPAALSYISVSMVWQKSGSTLGAIAYHMGRGQ
jgi:hypothetical protein